MTQSRFDRRGQRAPLANWMPALLCACACGDAQPTAVPPAASSLQMPSQPGGANPATEGTGSPGSGAAPNAEGTNGDATPATNEGVDAEIDRSSAEPGAGSANEPETPGEPSASGAGSDDEPAPAAGQPIATIAAPGFPAGSPPRLVPLQFDGPITGRAVLLNIYLPPGYDSSAESYPVLYDLHGLTDSRDTNPGPVIRSFEASMRSAVVGPLIVVFPQSFADGYYADSRDGARPGETQMIRELIPFIDGSFRTLAHRARRGVSGFSMGGFGALAYALKYPELFSVGIGYDSALDTWETLLGRRAYIAAAAFGNDESHFDQISPWASSARNAAVLAESSSLRIVPGTQYRDFNEAFRGHLTALGIPHGFTQTDCPHDYNCLMDREGTSSWALVQAEFSQPAIAIAP